MKRHLEKQLTEWKNSSLRAPLLLRGARQVGKSWLIEFFGREHFDSLAIVNLEQRPEFRLCFETLIPKKIISSIELLIGSPIVIGKTLLFLDEIQECPQAIMSLRYFKEQMPQLHVIGAGSLLEFVLNDKDFSMPVGRVQFLHLRPLSFYEYLEACGRGSLCAHLRQVTISSPPTEVIHGELLKLLREYVAIGGMPAVISAYLQTESLYQCQNVQSDILSTYRRDFGKYAKVIVHKNLALLFEKAPGLIGQWFKYSKISQDVPSRDLKVALQYLSHAGLVFQVYHTAAVGLPLLSTRNEAKFKLLFLDVGLAKRAALLDIGSLLREDILLINQGALTEQFVGQELLAYSDSKMEEQLYFWVREARGSSAEVDYVIPMGNLIVPIEVKSGTSGRLKSLKLFMEEKQSLLGIHLSTNPLGRYGNVISVPLYMVAEIPRLVNESLRAEQPDA